MWTSKKHSNSYSWFNYSWRPTYLWQGLARQALYKVQLLFIIRCMGQRIQGQRWQVSGEPLFTCQRFHGQCRPVRHYSKWHFSKCGLRGNASIASLGPQNVVRHDLFCLYTIYDAVQPRPVMAHRVSSTYQLVRSTSYGPIHSCPTLTLNTLIKVPL